jgi:hypothetical protein
MAAVQDAMKCCQEQHSLHSSRPVSSRFVMLFCPQVPNISRTEYTLLDVNEEGFVSHMRHSTVAVLLVEDSHTASVAVGAPAMAESDMRL